MEEEKEENSRPSSPLEENDSEDGKESSELKSKKGKRPRKKSSAKLAEIEKRENQIKQLLEREDLPKYVFTVLKEEINERGHLFKLNDVEIERFWAELADIVNEEINFIMEEDTEGKDGEDAAVETLIAVINLMVYSTQIHDPKDTQTFTHTAMKLNMFMMSPQDTCPRQLQDEICGLCELCCLKEFNLPGDFFLNTFDVLFDLTLNDTTSTAELKPYVKRMWEMRKALGRVNLKAQSCEKMVEKLVRAVTCPTYLACKEGRHFIAYALTLDTKLIKKFHQAIKEFLPYCKRAQAVAYGEALYLAWSNGSQEVKQQLETQVIQNYMTHMFVFPRLKQELSQTGQNVFAILVYLRQHRNTCAFSKTLTELYQPLLWRHLRSGNNIERCNAAEVFLDVYPLEKPGTGRAEESSFLEKQQGEMVDLLTDTCSIVRIIAIKGICRKLCSAWPTFPQESLTIIFRNMIALTADSLAIVRKTLFDSLPILLNNQESAEYLGRILPSISNHLHDENEKVRRSFAKLLYVLKTMPDPPIRCFKVATVEHLAVRLKLDGPEVCSEISKILMNELYKVEMDVTKVLFRISKFIKVNPAGARKAFAYSSKSLEYENALRLMKLILVNLRAYVKSKEEQDESNPGQENNDQENQQVGKLSPEPKRRKRESREVLQPIVENRQDEPDEVEEEDTPSTSSVEPERSEPVEVEDDDNPFAWPEVSHALVDIVALLWTLHCTKLTSSDHESEHEDLMLLACRVIPLLLKYYKGTPTYFATIHLASMVPAAKLSPVSTVCSACVSHLKQLSEVTPDKEVKLIVHSLCAWNRFADIQDVVIDWLDQGFRSENLNMSKAPRDGEDGTRPRRVRFVAAGGKPMLALNILNSIFTHPLNSSRVKEKCYNQVYDLFIYMERIKVAIERRLMGGLPLDSPMLSDEFLIDCLYRYAKLILFLHRPEPTHAVKDETIVEPFDASTVFSDFVLWTIRVINPMLPAQFGDEKDLSVSLLKAVLRASANLIDLMYCSHDTILTVGKLVRTLLDSECSLWFVESSLQVMKHMKEYSEVEYYVQDAGDLMTAVVSSLLSRVLQSFSANKYSKEQVMDSIDNLYEVKTMLYEVIMGIKSVCFRKPDFLQTMMVLFTDSIVAILVHDIRQLQLLDPVDKVQDLPFLCGVMLSVITRPALASLWLKTLPFSISNTYSVDSNVLGGAVSLLHTLAHGELKLPKEDLKTAVQEAYTTVTQFSRESTQPDSETSTFSVGSIDIKKAAIPVLKDLEKFLDMELF